MRVALRRFALMLAAGGGVIVVGATTAAAGLNLSNHCEPAD